MGKRRYGVGGQILWVVTEDQGMASFVKFDQLGLGRLIENFTVFQIVNLAFEQWIIGEKFDGAERNAPNGDNIHSAIRIACEHFHNFSGTTDARDAIRHGKQHAKLRPLAHAFIDHFPVTWLENMQRQFSAGEKDDVKREKRDAIWPHKHHI